MNIAFTLSVLLACGQIVHMLPTSMLETYGGRNLAEEGEHFEGDMILSEEDIQEMQTSRNGRRSERYRWPGATLTYQIDGDFDDDQLATIKEAMAWISADTCITFKEREDEEDYVSIIHPPEGGCNSHVGKTGGEQLIRYPDWCLEHGPGSPAHELIHALGFYHQQSEADRDDFVTINWENIDSESHKHNFHKETDAHSTNFGVKYDYGSIMHYSAKAFGKKIGKYEYAETITVKEAGAKIGQRERLSPKDIEKINKMYNCS